MRSSSQQSAEQPELSPFAAKFARAKATPISAAWAMRYANAGLHPIKLAPPIPGDKRSGKNPVERVWQTRPLDVEALCAALDPRSNLGLRMGLQPDGETALVALDIDDMAAAEGVCAELGEPPSETLRTSTGSEGLHLIYRVPIEALDALSNFTKRSGIDLRAQGGQVVAAPSIHYTGGRYSTVIAPPAELPQAWLDWLIASSRPKANAASSDGAHDCPANLTRDDRWLEHARADLARLPPAVEGEGGGKLYQAACIAMRAWLLPRDTAEDLLLEDGGYNDRCEPPWNFDDAEHKANWDRTMARADGGAPSTIAWGSSRPQRISAAGVRYAEHPDELEVKDAGASALANAVEHAASAREQGHDPAVDNLICHLAAPAVGVFQRAGQLVVITHEAVDVGGVIRPEGAPMIRTLTQPRLKEIVRMTVGPTYERLVGDVMARGEWEHIRPLDAIVTYPVLRRDGTVLTVDGYDAPSRTLASMSVSVAVPDAPTQDDARAAVAMLLDLVSDFPFASDAARAAWLAMLCTAPARPAIAGPTPLGLLEASQRGSGKTLLADLLSVIATGSDAPRRSACKTKEEWDKSLFAIALAGDPLVLIDNITTMLSSDSLDMLLTGTSMSQRVLGVSETRTVAVRTVFLASANNARLSTDLVRRSISCRLQPDDEHPEQRTGFRRPDLLAYVREHRSALLGAVLTILRAYAVAGRPRVDARHMGSYESWCRVVRDALVWAGALDPATTQDDLRETADVERDEIGALLTAWHALLGERAVTVRELVESARVSNGTTGPQELYDALAALMPNGAEPSPHTVGNRMRTLRDQISGGLVLRSARDAHTKVQRWRVIRAK